MNSLGGGKGSCQWEVLILNIRTSLAYLTTSRVPIFTNIMSQRISEQQEALLLELVEDSPFLYKKTATDYKNKSKKDRRWKEIAVMSGILSEY